MHDKIYNDKISIKKPCNVSKSVGNVAALQYDISQANLPSSNSTVIQCIRILEANNLATNIKNDSGKSKPAFSHAHHIIPNELVVEGIDVVTQGQVLIGGSFTGVARFFDESWNGIFLSTYRNIDGLPNHSGNHPEYTNAVRKFVGDEIGLLVTNEDYAKEIARVFREQLSNYYKGGVGNISDDSDSSIGVNQYYQNIAYKYLREIRNKLMFDKDARRIFDNVEVSGCKLAGIWSRKDILYELGYILEHKGSAAADAYIDLSEFREYIEARDHEMEMKRGRPGKMGAESDYDGFLN